MFEKDMIGKLINGIGGRIVELDYKLLLFDELFEKEQEEIRKKKLKKKRDDGKVL